MSTSDDNKTNDRRCIAKHCNRSTIPTRANTMIDLVEIFDRYSEEHNKFGLVDDKPSSRPDLCAFMLLDRLLPGSEDRIISAVARRGLSHLR